MEPARKRPVCHTCGFYMAGHRRNNGAFICPLPDSPSDSFSEESTSTSSRASSSSQRSSSARSTSDGPTPVKPPRIDQSVPLPPREHGPWHWRNPNFISPAPSFYAPSEASTGHSTFIVDDEGKFTGVTSSGRSWLDKERSDPHDPFTPPPISSELVVLPSSRTKEKRRDTEVAKPQALNITFGDGSGPKWIVFGEDQQTIKQLLSAEAASKETKEIKKKDRTSCDWYPLLAAAIVGGVVALSAAKVLT